MGNWLGAVNKWNKNALLAFLSDLRSHLPNLEERELYTILQQGGTLPALRAALGGEGSFRQVLKDLKVNEGRRLEQAIQGVSDNEVAAHAEVGIADEGVADRENPLTLFDDGVFKDGYRETAYPHTGSAIADDTATTD